ncbi:MAG: hypothetical protein LUE87_07055 [Lachnospiraceae bacterium]|nr:hypothetical protein [Lachnospiraceae bacterium]
MATSSITHSFVVSDPEAVERFVNAIEESAKDKDRYPFRSLDKAIFLTDPEEITAFMEKREKLKRERKRMNADNG